METKLNKINWLSERSLSFFTKQKNAIFIAGAFIVSIVSSQFALAQVVTATATPTATTATTPVATATTPVATATTPVAEQEINISRLLNPNGSDSLSPGSIAILTGSNLTLGGPKNPDGSLCSAEGKPNAEGFYPNELCSTSVRVGGKVAPLVSVSGTSIRLQIPFTVRVDRRRQPVFVISGDNADSKSFSITRTTSPAFFRTASRVIESEYVEGTGTPVSVKDSSKTIPAGSTVTIFGTGFGNATTPLKTGQVSPKDAKQATAPQFIFTASTIRLVNGRTRNSRTTTLITPTAYGLVPNLLNVHFASFKIPENVSGGRATVRLNTGNLRGSSISGTLLLGAGKLASTTPAVTPVATVTATVVR